MFSSGILMVIAGPSGAGKTTLSHHLVQNFENTLFSVSTTTRDPRGEEIHGTDYFFVDKGEFQKRIEGGFFLEWARVHGNYYGTDGDWVREELASGNSVVLDIDVQGAVQVKKAVPSAVLIFVLPRSRETLLERLRGRSTDTEETVAGRMKAAAGEVASMGSFDYFIQNDDLFQAEKAIESIFQVEKRRLSNLGWPLSAREYHPGYFDGLSHWMGKKVVISSGPTREMIDDVRFISNRSSGLMGVSLAEAFLAAGAGVTLVSGPAKIMNPPGPVKLVQVESAENMLEALSRETRDADLLVMAAAVSDYSPSNRMSGKLRRKGSHLDIRVFPTPDVLASLKTDCPVVAFALEYGDGGEISAVKKMTEKGASAVFLNRGDRPGEGMETAENSGKLIFARGSESVEIQRGSKKHTAFGIASALGREFGRTVDE